MVIVSKEQNLPPIEVAIINDVGNPIPDARVRLRYAYSGLSSEARSGEDGVALIPLLYCDKEPMTVEAAAHGYQTETVGEYQPDRENYKLEVRLQSLKSEWEQILIPIRAADRTGSIAHPSLGKVHINRNQFHLANRGDVSVDGSVETWHPIVVGREYNLLWDDGTERVIRFLATTPGLFCDSRSQSASTA